VSESKPAQTTQQAVVRRPKIFGTLLSAVIRTGLCVSCGACVAVCPVSVVAMKGLTPTLAGKCILCEFCYYSCPRTELGSGIGLPDVPPPPPEDLERLVFGRGRKETEPFGVYIGCYTARSKSEEVLKAAADGGVVTSLLAYALKRGIIDCAVVSGVSETEPWKAEPKIVFEPDDLTKYAGTRYTTSSSLLAVGEAVENYDKRKIAVVGVPCQIRAVRKMQSTPMGSSKLGDRIALTIGLFCMECFDYEGLIREYLQNKKGVDLSKIRKFAIKKGKFIVKLEGENVVEVPLEEVKPYARAACHKCGDFTAELADLSMGSVGSAEGWSTTIARTDIGKKLLEDAASDGVIECQPLERVKKGLERVTKMTTLKREQTGGKQFITTQDLKATSSQSPSPAQPNP